LVCRRFATAARLPSRLHWFETQVLTQAANLGGLAAMNWEMIAKAERQERTSRTVLDMDSTEIPVYGEQEQSAYNAHYASTCYHPLLLFNSGGDCVAAKLRPGNVHSADDWKQLLLPEVERLQKQGKEVWFRADAAFAKPDIYEALEERGAKYAIRIPANDCLLRDIAELLTRPVGRPGHKPVVWYKSFLYKAASWTAARREVAKVEHHAGELFPRIGFVVTNLTLPSRAVVRFYNKRGYGRAVDQRGQAGGKDDAADLPPVPVERGVAVAERDRIQLGQPVAAAGAAEGNRNVVVDQLAAAAGEDRRPVGKACPLLLAVVGREPSDAAPVRKYAAADSGFAAAGRIGAAARRNQSGRRRGVEGGVSEKSLRNRANHGLLVLAKALPGASGSLALERMQKRSPADANGGIVVRSRESKMEIPAWCL
jgi:hypothetical protein